MVWKIISGFSLFWLLQIFLMPVSFADEIRPGYLELKENGPNLFSVTWKVPAKGNKKLDLHVSLPSSCQEKTQASAKLINSAYIKRWMVVCDGGLVEQTISVSGAAKLRTLSAYLSIKKVSSHCEFSVVSFINQIMASLDGAVPV